MLILEGEVTIAADSARGAIPISTLQAPSLLGELGSLAQLPRSATGRARTPVTALRFGRAALIEVARATPSLLIDIIGRMGERMRKVNGAISLYTHALAALEQHEFDPALLVELRNPIPDLADFGQTFGRMAEQIILRRQRDDEMASAAVIQRALLPKVAEFAAESGLDIFAGDDAGEGRRRRLLRSGATRRWAGRAWRRRRLRQGRAGRALHGHHQDADPHPSSRVARLARRDPEDERLPRQQQRRPAVCDFALRRVRSALGRGRILQLRPPSGTYSPRERRGRKALRRRPARRHVRANESQCGPQAR